MFAYYILITYCNAAFIDLLYSISVHLVVLYSTLCILKLTITVATVNIYLFDNRLLMNLVIYLFDNNRLAMNLVNMPMWTNSQDAQREFSTFLAQRLRVSVYYRLIID